MKELRREVRTTMSTSQKRAWKLHEFLAHTANVNSVSLGHKSGRVLATGGGDKKVNLWAVGKPNCIMSLSGHSTPVDCVRFSVTEEHVVAGSQAGALKIWDLAATKIIRTLTGHRSSIRDVAFHPYGDFLASGSVDSAIKMWDTRKKGCIFGYKGHNATVNSLKFSPDGQWIASGGDDNFVKIWDIRVGKVLSEFGDHHAPVSSVEFHPHEFLLASSSADRTVKFWDLESLSLISSSTPDVPPVRCIAFHPNGSCLFAGSSETLRVHGWEPPEVFDTVPTNWSKIQDIAISGEQLVGVSTQQTNVSLFIVDLRRVQPHGSLTSRASLSAGHSLRRNFNTERSSEFAESLNAMKGSEESDSLPTDPEDDLLCQPEIRIPSDFRAVFNPRRDLTRTPPPPEEFLPPTDEESSGMSHLTEAETPRLTVVKRAIKFKYVTTKTQSRQRDSPEGSPRRSSVPSLNVGQVPQSSSYPHQLSRSRSPDCYSSRPSSLSDDSCGPMSSRSENSAGYPPDSLIYQPPPRVLTIKHSPSEPSLVHRDNPGLSQTKSHLHPVPRNSERPLQCQVKPMPKPQTLSDSMQNLKTDDYCKPKPMEDDFVPIPFDKPSGLAIDDFLPKKCPVAFQGGVHVMDMDESNIFTNLVREHQSLLSVLVARQRNLRIIYNIWQSKDVKTALETAVELHDLTVVVDVLSVLVLRPWIWNLDLCVTLLPSILQLLQSRYEALKELCRNLSYDSDVIGAAAAIQVLYQQHMTGGCNALRLILKNFASVIKTNIESPIQTVGVDISREERYNKSMDCYRHLVAIRAYTLKRQAMQGKIGHAFRELHILLSNLD